MSEWHVVYVDPASIEDRDPILPALPGNRRWHSAPRRIGDVGWDDRNAKWMWLPVGLKWLEDYPFPEAADTPDIMIAVRDVARGA